MLVSSSFDFPAQRLPLNMQHVGTPIEDSKAPEWLSPWSWSKARRSLVIVSLSTLEQGQASLMKRILLALGQLDVHRLVTLGPALDPGQFAAPPNVLLERFIPHSAVLPQAGDGTRNGLYRSEQGTEFKESGLAGEPRADFTASYS